MYDLRWTTEALGSAYVRSTMYDVRCTICKFARVARDGGGENAAHVRCTIAMIARRAAWGVKWCY